MAAIFLSHSSKDNDLVEKLQAWLAANGHESVFIDFDPEKGIHGGGEWEQVLYQKLRQSQAILACITKNWIESKWCFAEIVSGREKGKKIIPLKMDDSPLPSILSDTQSIDLTKDTSNTKDTSDTKNAYARLNHALSVFFDWDASRIPYPGLSSFQESDAGVYFGREAETLRFNQLLESMRRQRSGAPGLLLILGASGSGKSSLIRAGMIPRLRKDDNWLILDPFRPRNDPAEGLARVIAAAHGSWSWKEIKEKLLTDENALNALCIGLLDRHPNKEASILLVIDQAEELFTTEVAANSSSFIRLLRAAIGVGENRLIVLAALRSNFLESFQNDPIISNKTDNAGFGYSTVTLDPINPNQFPTIIERPAERAGVRLDPQLALTMIADAPGSDTMPLLAFTLNQLWLRYHARERGSITLGNYRELGGVQGSIQRAAENAVMAVRTIDKELIRLRALFIPHLVRVSVDGNSLKRIAHIDQLGDGAVELLDPFVQERLLVTDVDIQGKKTVEITHEALLRTWTVLSTWITEAWDDLRLLENLRIAAKEWEDSRRQPDLLIHRDRRLEELQQLINKKGVGITASSIEHAYLAACISAQRERDTARQKEEKEKLETTKRLARNRLYGLMGLGAALIIVTVLGLLAFNLRNKARSTAVDLQNTVGFNARVLARDDKTLWDALDAAISTGDSTSTYPTDRLQAEEGLTTVVSRITEKHVIQSPEPFVAFNLMDSGRKLLASTHDAGIFIWDIEGQHRDTALTAHAPGEVGFAEELSSNDSFFCAAFVGAGRIDVRDRQHDSLILQLKMPDNQSDFYVRPQPLAYSLSPKSAWFAASLPVYNKIDSLHLTSQMIINLVGAKSIGIYNLRTKQVDTVDQQDIVTNMVFSNAQKYLAIGTISGGITIWSIPEKKIAFSQTPHPASRDITPDNAVQQLQFSQKDDTLFAATEDGMVRAWNLRDTVSRKDPLKMPVFKRTDSTENKKILFRLSPAGSRMITVHDGVAVLWDLSSGKSMRELNFPFDEKNIQDAAFSADGSYILTAGSGRITLHEGCQGYLLQGIHVSDVNLAQIRFIPDTAGIKFITRGDQLAIWAIYGKGFIRRIGAVLSKDTSHRKFTPTSDPLRVLSTGIPIAKVSPDKHHLVIYDFQENIQIRDQDGNLDTLLENVGEASDISFDRSGQYLLFYNSLPQDTTAWKVFRLSDHRQIASASAVGTTTRMAVSPDGSRVALVTAKDDSTVDIKLLDSKSGREITTLPDHTSDIAYLDFLTANRLAVIRGTGSTTIYHLDDNTSDTADLKGQPNLYNLHAHYYPEIDRIITSWSDSSIAIWNSRTGELIKKLETGHYVSDINLSADETKLVTASGPMAQIWNLASGQELARFVVDKEKDLTITDFLGDDKLVSAGTEVLYIYPISNALWYREAVRLKNSFKR